jgi:hypothetical protein
VWDLHPLRVAAGVNVSCDDTLKHSVRRTFVGGFSGERLTSISKVGKAGGGSYSPPQLYYVADGRRRGTLAIVEGEDAVNIVQQRTAVAPVVDVRDRTDRPWRKPRALCDTQSSCNVQWAAQTYRFKGGRRFAGDTQCHASLTRARAASRLFAVLAVESRLRR